MAERRSSTRISALGQGERKRLPPLYDSSFRHWQLWREVRGQPLFLTGNNPGEDEEELLRFVAHKAITMNYAYSAIRVMLSTLRHVHLMEWWPDPLQDKVRLVKDLGSLRHNELVHGTQGERQSSAVEAGLAHKRERLQLEGEQLVSARAQQEATAKQSTQHAAALQGRAEGSFTRLLGNNFLHGDQVWSASMEVSGGLSG